MAEAEAPVGAGHQDLLGHRLAQGILERAAVQPGDRGEHRLVGGAGDGDGARHALRVGGEALDAHQKRIAQALRGGPATVEPGRQQLLGEERVALAAGEQAVQQRAVGRGAEDIGQSLAQLGAIEWLEQDAARPLEALELGEQRAQGMAAMQLVGAIGQDHAHALLAQGAGEEHGEGTGRAVGPVHVLQDEDQRRGGAEAVDQLQHGLEQPKLVVGAPGLIGRARLLQAGKDRRQLMAAAGADILQGRMTLAHQRVAGH